MSSNSSSKSTGARTIAHHGHVRGRLAYNSCHEGCNILSFDMSSVCYTFESRRRRRVCADNEKRGEDSEDVLFDVERQTIYVGNLPLAIWSHWKCGDATKSTQRHAMQSSHRS